MLEKKQNTTEDKTILCEWEHKSQLWKKRVTWKKRKRGTWEVARMIFSSREQQWWRQACNNGSHLQCTPKVVAEIIIIIIKIKKTKIWVEVPCNDNQMTEIKNKITLYCNVLLYSCKGWVRDRATEYSNEGMCTTK